MIQQLPGDRIREIKTIEKFKVVMLDLFRGYPGWKYYGVVESYFQEEGVDEIMKILEDDEMISVERKDGKKYYRLKNRGLDFAVSMINLQHSEKMIKLTKFIIGLTIVTLIGLGVQIGLSIF
jgi:hypothetical protein